MTELCLFFFLSEVSYGATGYPQACPDQRKPTQDDRTVTDWTVLNLVKRYHQFILKAAESHSMICYSEFRVTIFYPPPSSSSLYNFSIDRSHITFKKIPFAQYFALCNNAWQIFKCPVQSSDYKNWRQHKMH